MKCGVPTDLGLANTRAANDNSALKMVIPIGRSGYAIAAGYLGLFSILVLPAPFAILFGVLAIRDIKKNPEKGGLGRAWFGILAGILIPAIVIIGIINAPK